MNAFWQQLKQRMLVQWALAYLAFWFALLQGVDIIAEQFDWPPAIERYLILALAVGFFVTLVVTWYHGERGYQKVSAAELLIIALLLLIGGALMWQFGLPRPSQPASVAVPPAVHRPSPAESVAREIPANSVAVLPFENLSDDKSNAYFASGIQDLILTKLASIGNLKVISRTSTAELASHPDDLPALARRLGVATVLEGSVQKQGNKVLINVRLVHAASSSNIWAEAYTRDLDDIFGVEGDVAQQIAQALQAKLSPDESRRLSAVPTQDQTAFDLFLRAEDLTFRGDLGRDVRQWKAAIPLYRQAIAHDPRFALAYARLAYATSEFAWFGGGGEDTAALFRQARKDAEHAVQLAPDLATAYVAMAFVDLTSASTSADTTRSLDTALRLRPNDADALATYGYVERRQGHFDRAIDWMKRALAHDPRNSTTAAEIGFSYLMTGNSGEAQVWFDRALEIDPANSDAIAYRSITAFFASGNAQEAQAMLTGTAPTVLSTRAKLLTYQRDYAAAIHVLESLPDTPDALPLDAGSKPLLLGKLYLLAREPEHARPQLVKALALARTQLGHQQGLNQAFVWQQIAAALIGLGQTREGLDAVARVQALLQEQTTTIHGPGKNGAALMVGNAILYAQAKRADLAVPLIQRALASPGVGADYTPRLLRIDPAWDPIREDPAFQALLQRFTRPA